MPTASATSSSQTAQSTLTTSRPPFAAPNADATRSARLELGQFDLRDLDDLLMFVSDDKQKQVADDFGQTEVVHKSATAQQTAIVEKIVVSPRIMKRVDAVFCRGDPQVLLCRRRAADHLARPDRGSLRRLLAPDRIVVGARPRGATRGARRARVCASAPSRAVAVYAVCRLPFSRRPPPPPP